MTSLRDFFGDDFFGDDFFERLFPFSHGLLWERSRDWGDTTECLRDPGEGVVKWRNFTGPFVDRLLRLAMRLKGLEMDTSHTIWSETLEI